MKSLTLGMVICVAGAGVVKTAPAWADVDLTKATVCFDTAVTDQSDPAVCIDHAHASCLDSAQETPAVSGLCFQKARAVWSDAFGAEMRRLATKADPRVVQIARIETKYDLLSNLLQCDRLQELSLAVSDLGDDAVAVQGARCQATAPALSFMRLYLRGTP